MTRVDKKAFTLVELMIVVLILAALTAIAIPRIMGGSKTAKINACKTNIDLINSQVELYYNINGTWPADIRNVTDDPNYFPDGPPVCPFKLDYSYNTSNNRTIDHGH